MDSIYSESNFIYIQRNSSIALDSTTPLYISGQFRKYDKKFENLRRLGYSPQLFIINILLGLSFNLLNLGLSAIIKVTAIPWFDAYFLLLIIGCKIKF